MSCFPDVYLRTQPDMTLECAGPIWYRKKSKKVLLAGRRQELSRRRKHAGNIADGLRCSPWRRAESPGKKHHLLCGGDTHGNGSNAIVHPSKIALLQRSKLAETPALGYLAKKICHFVHDFHPLWVARLHLPETNGEHYCSSLSSCMMMATYVRSSVLWWMSCTTTLMAGTCAHSHNIWNFKCTLFIE